MIADDDTALVLNKSRSLAKPTHRFAERGAEILEKGTPKNTRLAYESDFRQFAKWCEQQPEIFEPFPAVELAVVGHLEYLFDEGRRMTTIERRLSGIVRYHKERGEPSLRTEIVLRLLNSMKSIRADAGESPRMAAPLTIVDLVSVVRALDERPSDRATRDRALLLLGWSCAMRRSELAELRRQDVGKFTKEGTTIRIRKSKTDQRGKGRVMPLAPETTSICPIRALESWLTRRGDDDGPLFWRMDRTHLMEHEAMPQWQVADAFHGWTQRAGLEVPPSGMLYSAHSLRAGFITEAVRLGIDPLQVKERSGHKSYDIFLRYVRLAQTFENNPQQGIIGKGLGGRGGAAQKDILEES